MLSVISRTKSTRLLLLLVGAGVVMVVLLAMAITSLPSQFDASKWREAGKVSGDGRAVRSAMVKDLLARHDFKGWSAEEVEELLGPPDKGWPGFSQWDFVYVLGLECSGGYSLDDEALGFKLDANGRVTTYGLSTN